MESSVAEQLASLTRRFHISDIPKITPEEAQKHSEELEQRFVEQYQAKRAKNFTSLRSIYNESNVLSHSFKDVKPVSGEFTALAKKLVKSQKNVQIAKGST